jgi:uncharacterized protein YecA (UPF0149 family)
VLDAEGREIKKLSKTSCDTCGNEYVPYSLSEVPEEKILEQRERYRQMKKTEFIKMLSAYQDMSKSNILADMFREVGDRPVGYTVKEDDAGQEAIDAAERADREAKRRGEIEFKEQYRGAQRNDKCRCGSGNKYKKCCLPKVNSIR